MSFAETALLGAIAGITIYLGLPIGRVRRIDDRVRVGLAMFSAGILAFIFMDVTTHAQSIIAATLDQFKHGQTGFLHVVWLFALLAGGFIAGTAGIAGAERRLRGPRRAAAPSLASVEARRHGARPRSRKAAAPARRPVPAESDCARS